MMAVVVQISATYVTMTSAAGPFVASSPIGRDDPTRRPDRIYGPRGGGAVLYEYNPNHEDYPSLGDVDGDGFYRSSFLATPRADRSRPPPLTEVVRNYVVALRDYSPTLCYGLFASIFVHVLWQFESSSSFVARNLRDHFQCSRYNVLRRGRYHALILSAYSHASFRHLAVNVYAYLTFGRSVRQVLARRGISLWPFVVSSAIFGNLAFLAFDNGQGSCIGLSGVTLSLMAFDALIHPTKELRMFVSFIPLSISAYHLYLVLLGVSVLGILGLDILERGSIAHSTHLGGLVCGSLFFEAYQRGWLQRAKKAYLALRRR